MRRYRNQLILSLIALVLMAGLPPFALAATTVVPSAGVPQPRRPGDIVGIVVQNLAKNTSLTLPLTFGEVFKPGALPRNAPLWLDIGKNIPVQVDPRTYNPDGSIAMATLTVMAPPLPGRTATGAMLMRAPTGAPPEAPPLSLAAALTHYSLIVELGLQNSDGSLHETRINGASALETALQDHRANIWRRGPDATEAIVSVPVQGSFRIVFDITAYANGSFSSDVRFNNDITMVPSGGVVTYSESIVQDGKTVSHHASITQYQYQDWHSVVGTPGSSGDINIQHDITYLEATGAILDFDLRLGVSTTVFKIEEAAMAKPEWGQPLSPNGITQYMPGVGGRPDIGPTTQWNAAWLVTQNAIAARFALGQADAAGAVPWHIYYPKTGEYLTTNDIPNVWTFPTTHTNGTTPIVLPSSKKTGWVPDTSHQPDLSYIPYLLTGKEYYLDQLNAQATWSVTSLWPSSEVRNNDEGLVVRHNQVRGAAWCLREVVEAAYANPTGTPMRRYFERIERTNFSWMVSHRHAWTIVQGEAHGYLPGGYGSSGVMAPWQQDFLASTVVLAVKQHVPNAMTFLKWEMNYLVGRFLNGDNGFNPRDGVAYVMFVYNPHTLETYKTWAEIGRATEAHHASNRNGWIKSSYGYYGQLGLATLAGIINVTGSAQARAARHWLLGSGAPFTDPASLARSPQFAIVPARGP